MTTTPGSSAKPNESEAVKAQALKPCPFCGRSPGYGTVEYQSPLRGNVREYWAGCPDTDGGCDFCYCEATPELAAKRWNTRHTQAAAEVVPPSASPQSAPEGLGTLADADYLSAIAQRGIADLRPSAHERTLTKILDAHHRVCEAIREAENVAALTRARDEAIEREAKHLSYANMCQERAHTAIRERDEARRELSAITTNPAYGDKMAKRERDAALTTATALREALTKAHLALTALGSRIRNDRGEWRIRKPHHDMPQVVQQVNEAMAAYHAAPTPEPRHDDA